MPRHAPLPLVLMTLLAACGGGGGEETAGGGNGNGNGTTTTLPSKTSPFDPTVLANRTIGALTAPWNRYFVTTYDPAALATVRTRFATYLNDRLSRDPMLSARVDYAHSVGLTGAGQIITIVDDGVYSGHDQFDGKGFVSVGTGPLGSHGTAVASVAAGNGTAGMTGVAPNADLISGAAFSYAGGLDWNNVTAIMDYARTNGSIVANNSWGIADQGGSLTYDDVMLNTTAFTSDTGLRTYIDSLRAYAQNGVIVFAQTNNTTEGSASAIAALPSLENLIYGTPLLEDSWITVINAIPTYNIATNKITAGESVSEWCRETAAYCMAANGRTYGANYDSANPNPSGYALWDGASFAAPQVAGAIALLAEAFPDLSAQELRDRLLATADNEFFSSQSISSVNMVFAPGVSHRYSEQFGHGFLDLSAALLPIGQSYVPTASGERLLLSQPLISGGPASGEAIALALQDTNVAFGDSMGGSFTAKADILAASSGAAATQALPLSRLSATDLSAHRAETRRAIAGGTPVAGLSDATGQSAMTLFGATPFTLDAPDQTTRLTAYVADATATAAEGLSLSHSFDLGAASLSVSLGTGRLQGSVLGVTAPGREADIASDMQFLGLDYTAALGGGRAISLGGEFGTASGNGAGLIRDMGRLSYDSISLAWHQTGVATRDDTLSLFLRRPVGIRSGTATLDFATDVAALSAEPAAAGFRDTTVDLAPQDRQIDLGFEYAAPLGQGADLILGMTYAENLGQRSGQSDVAGTIGLQLRF